MARTAKRAALYVRVSTDQQTVENQVRELQQVAERRGWTVVETYSDEGISGAKCRDKRPGLDAMLKDASRRKFDVVMVWAIDRLGRSLIDLLGSIQHLEACGVDLYLDQQNIDTTTPMGRLVFLVTGPLPSSSAASSASASMPGLPAPRKSSPATASSRPRPARSAGSSAALERCPFRSGRRASCWPPAWASARSLRLPSWASARCTSSPRRCVPRPDTRLRSPPGGRMSTPDDLLRHINALADAAGTTPGEMRPRLSAMPVDEMAALIAKLPGNIKTGLTSLPSIAELLGPDKWTPSPGPQTMAYESLADVLGFGGEPGGGKSQLIIGLAFTRHRTSYVMRRNYADLSALIDDALRSTAAATGSMPRRHRGYGSTMSA
jgi:hypothetical protein